MKTLAKRLSDNLLINNLKLRKNVETEVPRNKKRIDDCKALIGLLDTKYAEKQELENRIKKLEDGNAETNKLLNQILNKLK